MSHLGHMTLRHELASATLLVTTVVVGIVLPIEFLAELDGYMIYMRPWELFPVWGWAWLTYVLVGLVVGCFSALIAISVALLFQRPLSALVTPLANWVSLSLGCLALLRGGKLWIGAHNFSTAWWLSQNQYIFAGMILTACAVAVWFRPDYKIIPKQLARYATAAGCFVACGAPLIVVVQEPTAPKRPPLPLAIAARPDVIMLTIDAFSASHASLYGYSRPTTTNLDKFAAKADVFERYYANGNFTTPTVNTFINGVRPWTHRAIQPFGLSSDEIAAHGMAARLRSVGYQTLAVVTNPLATPFQNGNAAWFDKIIDGRTQETIAVIQSSIGTRYRHLMPALGLVFVSRLCDIVDRLLVFGGIWSTSNPYDPDLTFAAARDMIHARRREHPIFLWVHLFSAHSPYATSAPFLGRFDSSSEHRTRFDSIPPWQFLAAISGESLRHYEGRYDEALALTDARFGAFMDWLKQVNLYQKSLIVVSADHGESFLHQYGGHGGPMLYEGVIHIPLIIKEPDQTKGRRLDTISEQIDLMPTILDLVDVPIADSVEGRSLVPALSGQRIPGAVFSMAFEQSPRWGQLSVGTVAMLEERWKYVHYFGYRRAELQEDSLYDLQADPSENDNLIALHPRVAATMRAAIDRQMSLHGRPIP